ncbi:DUF86 domain-containing protein [Gloeocapsa sp. PCC 73106]|uniref:HepT-like ribonuclease domain-containing protein n=1 Tax=Gloeocapsa sp. PCC 73106 TaxID=102232 RepID=UPI0002ABA8DF|nr:DUF86 domain-containing protein [Gloeocapsa sp. PCC 73106]ELS00095.1 hypothetical protein GLO73106DRAFT_00039500 [Gloeocapsa sp. PCC 73106]
MKDDLTRLKHIRDAARQALEFVSNKERQDLNENKMLSLALVRLIEIMGEAAKHISESCQNKYSRIPWRQIMGMRNRLIHAYFDVDLDIIWKVVTQDLDSLLLEVELAIEDLKDQDT